jgi:hypothetical protein
MTNDLVAQIERLENELLAATIRIDNDKLEFARIYATLTKHSEITNKANDQAEEFERKWYLACDERDDHAQQLRKEQLTVQGLINELAECRNLLGEALQDERYSAVEMDALKREIAGLTREQVGLALDAARYRWIVDQIVGDKFECLEDAFGVFGDADRCEKHEFDAAIDNAMKGETK